MREIAYQDRFPKFESMVGKTFISVHIVESGIGDSDALVFTVSDTEQYAQLYNADCCASCSIEDVCGDLKDLVGSPIVRAEANGNDEVEPEPNPNADSETWTFYRIGTVKGTVVIRWYGSSNGYYSEYPSFERIA